MRLNRSEVLLLLCLCPLALSAQAVDPAASSENPPAEQQAPGYDPGPTVDPGTAAPPKPDQQAKPAENEAFPSMITIPETADLKRGTTDGPLTPRQAPELSQQTLPDYRIGVGDVLKISVWRELEVSVDAAAVRSDGKISLPLIKEVYVMGLVPGELEKQLTREFSQYINNPEVTVIVREINSQKVYLVGGVVRPGSLLLRTPMTILQVLAEAGGLTDFAKKKKIYILRKDGGQESRINFNYEAVLKGDSPEQNVPVRPGDTIVVPE